MAKKSAINRILKPYVNASDDSEIISSQPSEKVPASANSKVIDIESEVVSEPVKEIKPETEQPTETPKQKQPESGPDF